MTRMRSRDRRNYSHTEALWRVEHDERGKVIAKELVGWRDVDRLGRPLAERGLRRDDQR